MKKYELEDKIYYFPVRENNKIFMDNQSIGVMPAIVDESSFSVMLDFLQKNSEHYFIIDFTDVKSITFSLKHYKLLVNYRFILLGVEKKYFEIIQKQNINNDIFKYKKYENDMNTTLYLIYFSGGENNCLVNFLIKHIKNFKERDIIDDGFSQYLISYIISKILIDNSEHYDTNNLKYLESSNVYVNCYLNVKCIFLNIDILIIVIEQLKNIIYKNFLNANCSENKNICLLGVSNNGIILSRILAYVMKMNVKSFNHIGPKYCLDCDNSLMEQYRNQKYILISDVICLGGEYRMTKGIVSVLNSELLGGVGIIKIRDIYRGEDRKTAPIYAIVNNIEDYGCDYKIYIDKKEIRNEKI